jgi:starvation-inducible DNA-binding protein
MDEKFINGLKIAFASQYAFAIKAQNFHWNVEGQDFYQLHQLFETIYDEVYGAVDAFAENIRKIKGYAPASLHRFSVLSAIDDEIGVLSPEAMVAELLRDSEKMQEIMKHLFVQAENIGEHGLSNFLADRQDAFAKHAWFLRATAKA